MDKNSYRNLDNLPANATTLQSKKYGDYYSFWNYLASLLIYHLSNDSVSTKAFGFLEASDPRGHRIESQLRRAINEFVGEELGEIIKPCLFTSDVEYSWRDGFAVSRYVEISRPLEEKLAEKARVDPLGMIAFIESIRQKFPRFFNDARLIDEVGKHLNLQGVADGS